MEVKQGYKQTEVGVIPENWQIAILGENTEKVGSGITPTGGERVYKQEGRPFIRSQNVGWGHLLFDDVAFISDATHSTFQDTEIKIDDVFLNITGASIGRSAVADGRVRGGNVNQHVCIIRASQSKILARYLNYFLLSWAGQRQIDSFQAGGNRQGLNFGQVRSIRLPLPNPQEQRAIVEALSDGDALIESLEQLTAKKRQLKQGAMQELLTGKKRLPGFARKPGYKRTGAGVLPEDWEVSKLGALATFKTGPFGSALHQADYAYGGVPVINPMQIMDGKIQPTPSMAVTDQAARKLSEFRLSAGNLVIGRRGAMGRCAYVHAEEHGWLCGTGSMIIRTTPSLDARFIQRVLSSPPIIAEIENASVGSTMINLNQGTLGNLLVPLPPTKWEQVAIAVTLSDMDAEIAALEGKLAKARQIKQGMMQELLTGRIRLV